MRHISSLLTTVLLLFSAIITTPAHADLIDLAKKKSPERFAYAKEQGAVISPTPDGRSFYLLWYPDAASRGKGSPPTFIVTLHGHGSWATDEFYLWHRAAQKHGFGILAIQWWFGGGESPRDYYAPHEMYRIIEQVLRAEGSKKESALLHGFSRGSANSYAMAALDRSAGNFFRLIVSNSGGAMQDFPPNRDISSGRSGPSPFNGLHWAMFCGMRDENPTRDGCQAMEQARGWVQSYGGKVDLFIKDQNAGHGGFHRDPKHVESVLSLFERLGR